VCGKKIKRNGIEFVGVKSNVIPHRDFVFIVLFIAVSAYIADAIHPLAVIPGFLVVIIGSIYTIKKGKRGR